MFEPCSRVVRVRVPAARIQQDPVRLPAPWCSPCGACLCVAVGVGCVQEVCGAMEAAVAEVRQCGGLAEIARAVLALSNRLRLAGSLPPGAEGNAAQLQVLQRRVAAAFDVTRLPQLLDTRTLVGGGSKLSHVLVAMCASCVIESF